jgi:phosphoribosylformimino-5-aminoimidazole carboxamide ribotide isomerase
MRIIPAIDIIDGKCVRLTQGDYAQQKTYNDNPLEVARQFEDAGLKYLHLVDLDGAKAGTVINWHVIEAITSKTKLQVDFGGGIKKDGEIKRLFETGIAQVNLGSIAVKQKGKVLEWIETYGSEKIILSADVKNEVIAIHGWQESSTLNVIDFIDDYVAEGLTHVVCTDISTDGTLQGPNITLYKKIMSGFSDLKLIASGGVGHINDLVALKNSNLFGAIVGKAIYEGKISLEELSGL